MKKKSYIVFLFLSLSCKSVKQHPNEIKITSKKEVVANDYVISIDKIISDSRCPEGTNCIWAGELVMRLSVWQNKELKETADITFLPQHLEDNRQWFAKYLPENKKVLNCLVLPAKTDKPVELKDYKIELILE